MNKYLMIDGNNMGIRSAFAHKELKDANGIFTGIHYGFFKTLIFLKKKFKDYEFIVFWDGKSKRRITLSSENVEKKIIRFTYKSNREKNKKDEKFIDFYKQLPQLQEAITYTGIQQIYLPDFEADDVIAAYCKLLRNNNEIIVSTTDKDYFQLLYENVSIWDGLHLKMITKKDFVDEYKITPSQHIDVGALMGDNGDAIQGITAWGNKTALEEIQKHGSYKNVLNHYVQKYGHLENSFPKIESMLDLESLRLQKTKSGKQKYPDVYCGMPFSGVALAVEWKKIDPLPQKALMLLMYQERLNVAYSLKKVDDNIDGLPEIKAESPQLDELQEYFDKYSVKSLGQEIGVFGGEEVVNKTIPIVEKVVAENSDILEKVEEEKSTLFDF